MSEIVDSVKRRLIYIPDDEQLMLNELSDAPSQRASRVSHLLITRSPCLSEGHRTPPELSNASTNPSLEDLPPLSLPASTPKPLKMLSASAANCLHRVSSKKATCDDAFIATEEKQNETNELSNKINSNKNNVVMHNLLQREEMANCTECKDDLTVIAAHVVHKKNLSKSCKGEPTFFSTATGEMEFDTLTPTPLPRRGTTPIHNQNKIDPFLLVSYDGSLIADGSGHFCPPRNTAEARKIVAALEYCKNYIAEFTSISSSSSLSSLSLPTTAKASTTTTTTTTEEQNLANVKKGKLLSTFVSKQKEKQRQKSAVIKARNEQVEDHEEMCENYLSRQEHQKREVEEKECVEQELENACNKFDNNQDDDDSATVNSWDDEKFAHLSSNGATSNSLLSSSTSSFATLSEYSSEFTFSSSFSEEEEEEEEQEKEKEKEEEEEQMMKKKSARRLHASTYTKKQKREDQQERDKLPISCTGKHKNAKEHKVYKTRAKYEAQSNTSNNSNVESGENESNHCEINRIITIYKSEVQRMTAKALREILHTYALSTNGSKCVLRSRLLRYLKRKESYQSKQHYDLLSEQPSETQFSDDHSFAASTEICNNFNDSEHKIATEETLSSSNKMVASAKENDDQMGEINKGTILSPSQTSTHSSPLMTLDTLPYNSTPSPSTRLQLLHSPSTEPAKSTRSFWNTLVSAGSKLFTRTSHLSDECNKEEYTNESNRAESVPSFKRRRSEETTYY